MKIEFDPDARIEVREARRWYRQRSSMAAASFAHEVDRAVGEIRENPERYREAGDGTRRFFLRRFPFTIVYRLSNEVITIVAVAHRSAGLDTGPTVDTRPLTEPLYRRGHALRYS